MPLDAFSVLLLSLLLPSACLTSLHDCVSSKGFACHWAEVLVKQTDRQPDRHTYVHTDRQRDRQKEMAKEKYNCT